MVSVRFQEQDLSELHALVNANQLNLSSIIRLIINSFLKQKGGSICLIDKDSVKNDTCLIQKNNIDIGLFVYKLKRQIPKLEIIIKKWSYKI